MLNQGNLRTMSASRRLAEALARRLLSQRTQPLRDKPQLAQAALASRIAALPQHPNARVSPQDLAPEPEVPFSSELLDLIDRLNRNLPDPFKPSPHPARPVSPPEPEIKGEFAPPIVSRHALDLSPDDIKILKKVLSTEAVAGLPLEIYRQQAAGIIDTILNRRVHGKWGDSIEAVVNAPYQFSDINGPVAWRRNRRSVNQISDDVLKQGAGLLASQFVDEYLARRAGGEPSSVGGHLNYANPYYSDASNLSWIRKLDGPRFGLGRAVHWHGTAQGLTPVDPNYAIRIAGQRQFPSAFGVEPLVRTREAPQFDAPPALPQQLPPLPQQQQMPAAPASPQRGHIHPAILEALIRQQQPAPPAGIDPEVWKHMTEQERALWESRG